MLREAVEKARTLPEEIRNRAVRTQELRQALYDLLDEQKRLEAEVAMEVAAARDRYGRNLFPNEAMRQGETFRRLQESQAWQQARAKVDEARRALWEAEADLERVRLEHRTALALLDVAAGLLRAGHGLEEIERLLAPDADTQASNPAEPAAQDATAPQADVSTEAAPAPAPAPAENGDGLKEAPVRILECRASRSPGTVRCWCAAGDRKVAVYGKNGVAEALARAVGQTVTIRYREGDRGWIAVQVA